MAEWENKIYYECVKGPFGGQIHTHSHMEASGWAL